MKFEFDPQNPPKLSEEDKQRFDAIRDEDIDYSEIPELDEAFWAGAKVLEPRTKPIVSLRLPEDVIDHFKAEFPKGYTSRMAAVLSAYVAAQKPR